MSDPDNSLYDRGMRHYAARDYAQAIAQFERVAGESVRKTFCIATCQMELGGETSLRSALDAFCGIFEQCAKQGVRVPYGCAENAVAAATKLCALLEDEGRPGTSNQCLEALLRVKVHVPDNPVLDYNLGRLYEMRGCPKLAIKHLDQALADGNLDANADLWVELARAQAQTGQTALARKTLETGLKAISAQATAGRASLLRELGNAVAAGGDGQQLIRAIQIYQEGLAVLCAASGARNASLECGIHMNLGNCHLKMADLNKALEEYHLAIKADPNDPLAIHNLGMGLLYAPDVPEATTFFTMQGLGRRLAKIAGAKPSAAALLPPQRHAERPIRIGYISPDLLSAAHPVAKFARAMLAHVDPAQFAVFCYDTRVHKHALAASVAECGQEYHPSISWHTVRNLGTEEAKDLVLSHGLDVCVDLAGYSDGNRADIFAHRVAPIQIGHVGFPFHTGLASIDKLVCDGIMLPSTPGLLEKALVLPQCHLSWPLGEADLPAVERLVSPGKTYICLNKPNKLNESVRRLFAKVLRADFGSLLILKNQTLVDLFGREFPDLAARVSCPPHPTPDYRDFLRLYNKADVALDTFPWTGTPTTCEALSMGTQVVTLCPPDTAPYHQRSTASLLYFSDFGLEGIADSEGDFVRLCLALRPATTDTKRANRAKFLASSVCSNPDRYAEMWGEAIKKLCCSS